MKLLTKYLNKKRRKKLYTKLFALKTDSAKFLQEFKACKEAADNVRMLIKVKEHDPIDVGGIYLSCYLKQHNAEIIKFESNAATAHQKYLNSEEAILIIQKELDSIQ